MNKPSERDLERASLIYEQVANHFKTHFLAAVQGRSAIVNSFKKPGLIEGIATTLANERASVPACRSRSTSLSKRWRSKPMGQMRMKRSTNYAAGKKMVTNPRSSENELGK